MDINYLKPLLKPVEYTIKGSGKNTRSLVIKYIQNLLNNDNNSLTSVIIDDINISHNASLVIDDIQDDSKKRRGQDCAHLIYGLPLSLNSAYLSIFQMLKQTDDKYPSKISQNIRNLYIKSLEKIHIGQGLDIYWTQQKYIPNLEEYLYMIDNKTGILFKLAAELCFETVKISDKSLNEERKEQILELMLLIGRLFQIRDDYINLTSPKYWRLKGFCEDFDEKKVSYVFTQLKKQDEHNNLYQQLCSINKLTDNDKIKLYTYIYNKKIFHQIYLTLNTCKLEIIKLEQQITKNTGQSEFLKMFFDKLDYNLPIEPDKIKPFLLMSSVK